MRVLVTSAGFPPAYLGGGPIRSVEALLLDADSAHEAFVLTNNYDQGTRGSLVADNDQWIHQSSASVLYIDPGFVSLLRGVRRSLKVLPDVIYVNSLFSLRVSIIFQAICRLPRKPPLAIAPRGELDPGALAIRWNKKRLYLRWATMLGFFKRVIWHASSDIEALHIRNAIPQAKNIIVKENDTKLPSLAYRPPPEDCVGNVTDGCATGQTPLRSVFFSRLSRKKGLDVALKALEYVHSRVSLDVIGPEEDSRYVAYCKEISRRIPEHIEVRFLGPIEPSRTREVLGEYDLKLLPTAGENFGHVIAESLSVSCPVMCTDTTPWSSVLDAGGGVVVPTQNPLDWAEAIESYASGGPRFWRSEKQSSAVAYENWRARATDPHFFELLEASLR